MLLKYHATSVGYYTQRPNFVSLIQYYTLLSKFEIVHCSKVRYKTFKMQGNELEMVTPNLKATHCNLSIFHHQSSYIMWTQQTSSFLSRHPIDSLIDSKKFAICNQKTVKLRCLHCNSTIVAKIYSLQAHVMACTKHPKSLIGLICYNAKFFVNRRNLIEM